MNKFFSGFENQAQLCYTGGLTQEEFDLYKEAGLISGYKALREGAKAFKRKAIRRTKQGLAAGAAVGTLGAGHTALKQPVSTWHGVERWIKKPATERYPGLQYIKDKMKSPPAKAAPAPIKKSAPISAPNNFQKGRELPSPGEYIKGYGSQKWNEIKGDLNKRLRSFRGSGNYR